jgi:hypothetical protein
MSDFVIPSRAKAIVARMPCGTSGGPRLPQRFQQLLQLSSLGLQGEQNLPPNVNTVERPTSPARNWGRQAAKKLKFAPSVTAKCNGSLAECDCVPLDGIALSSGQVFLRRLSDP